MHIGGEKSGDFDLNLAPIIDCFTVLITYLLVSASFLSLGALEAEIAETSQSSPAPVVKDPPISMAIELGAAKQLDVRVTGGRDNLNLTYPIAAQKTDWNLTALLGKIDEIQHKWPSVNEASVSAQASVQYREVVKILEAIKKPIGKVFLAD